MPSLSSSRGRLDSIVYWSAFLLISCFITYFLNAMIVMASDEDHRYQDSTRMSDSAVRIHVKAKRTSETANAPSVDDTLEEDGY